MDQPPRASEAVKPVVLTASSSLIKSSPLGFTQPRHSGSLISLKVHIVDLQLTKTLQFWPQTQVFEAVAMLREKVAEIAEAQDKYANHGFFVPHSDASKGVWLEASRSLEHYRLMTGDTLHFANKLRRLQLRLLDGERRTLLVDDSQSVGQLMLVVCGQMVGSGLVVAIHSQF